MKYALISDIHANLQALTAVLDDIGHRDGVDATYHLGDLVGYAAAPNQVVALLDQRGIPGVMGNYDSTVATGYRHCGCRAENSRQEELAHVSYEWTRAHTSAEAKARLAVLPFRIDLRPLGGHVPGPTITLVHATAASNLVYVTEDRPDSFLAKAAAAAGLQAGDVLCFGHTHRPWHRVVGGIHFVNTGSVGRPKDGDWRAGYVVLDVAASGATTVDHVRVDYDVDGTARDVDAAGLPEEFAEFLRSGGRSM